MDVGQVACVVAILAISVILVVAFDGALWRWREWRSRGSHLLLSVFALVTGRRQHRACDHGRQQ
jgi:hypothetical protein